MVAAAQAALALACGSSGLRLPTQRLLLLLSLTSAMVMVMVMVTTRGFVLRVTLAAQHFEPLTATASRCTPPPHHPARLPCIPATNWGVVQVVQRCTRHACSRHLCRLQFNMCSTAVCSCCVRPTLCSARVMLAWLLLPCARLCCCLRCLLFAARVCCFSLLA